MALIIEQRPLYNELAVGQDFIFTVADDPIVANKFRVKYVAKVRVGKEVSPSGSAIGMTSVGTFKTTPNNKGKGIFDLSSVLENQVSPDCEPQFKFTTSRPEYKTRYAGDIIFPLHLVNKWSLSENNVNFVAIDFYVEYADSATGTGSVVTQSTDPTPSAVYTIIDGVIQYDDVLTLQYGNYGYDMTAFTPNSTAGSAITSALSNAPQRQYARITDYGTLPFLNLWESTQSEHEITTATITLLDSTPSVLATTVIDTSSANGGYFPQLAKGEAPTRLMYLGCFPGNLNNWWTDFATHKDDIDRIWVSTNIASTQSSKTYEIKIICDNKKGYEPIRLCWVNQWGTWDYYTFNQKSIKSTSTKKTTYQQIKGSWNEDKFKVAGYKGGKRNFHLNATERIKINTDFLSDEESIWMEGLMNSPSVFILNGYDSTESVKLDAITNKYVEPVVVTTSSFKRKTVANDKLIQYTFDIEKSKTKRTQSA